ncbi:MAG: MAPEG family protein [Kofleriaceae bacterium]
MTSELRSLTWVTALTAVLWMPYMLDTIAVRGLINAVGYDDNPKPIAPWAARLKKAHANAIENLVVFAALVLIAHAAGVSNQMTVMACQIYFWARVVHALSYTFGIPWVRTIGFLAGFACQAILIVNLL